MTAPILADLHIHGGYGIDLMKADSGEIILLSQKLKKRFKISNIYSSLEAM